MSDLFVGVETAILNSKDAAMSLTIYTYPDPILAQKAKDISEITPELRQLAADMAATMYENKGVGLAAPQVGQLVRMVVVDISGPENRAELLTLINPVILSRDGTTVTEEGCLSVPIMRTNVERSEKVTLKALDLDGKEVIIEADGLKSICFQHELDHLDGTLILDHISRLKRALYDKKVKKWMKRDPAN